MSVHLSGCLDICISICTFVCKFVHLSVPLYVNQHYIKYYFQPTSMSDGLRDQFLSHLGDALAYQVL